MQELASWLRCNIISSIGLVLVFFALLIGSVQDSSWLMALIQLAGIFFCLRVIYLATKRLQELGKL